MTNIEIIEWTNCRNFYLRGKFRIDNAWYTAVLVNIKDYQRKEWEKPVKFFVFTDYGRKAVRCLCDEYGAGYSWAHLQGSINYFAVEQKTRNKTIESLRKLNEFGTYQDNEIEEKKCEIKGQRTVINICDSYKRVRLEISANGHFRWGCTCVFRSAYGTNDLREFAEKCYAEDSRLEPDLKQIKCIEEFPDTFIMRFVFCDDLSDDYCRYLEKQLFDAIESSLKPLQENKCSTFSGKVIRIIPHP